jgi:2-hydroxy-3-keto-5-methylthiopentenyl-1-phosphate phosphatase
LIEWIIWKFRKKHKPVGNLAAEAETETCEHIFMPVDSSGDTLACRNCGLMVNRRDLHKYNIFKNKPFISK